MSDAQGASAKAEDLSKNVGRLQAQIENLDVEKFHDTLQRVSQQASSRGFSLHLWRCAWPAPLPSSLMPFDVNFDQRVNSSFAWIDLFVAMALDWCLVCSCGPQWLSRFDSAAGCGNLYFYPITAETHVLAALFELLIGATRAHDGTLQLVSSSQQQRRKILENAVWDAKGTEE